jgi:hypothetical protein
MSTDDTVESLRNAMYSAATGETTKELVNLLQQLRDAVNADHAFTMAMAIAVGFEVATNQGVRESQREQQRDEMIEMLRMAYDRGRADVAAAKAKRGD